jgi:hypothetical protein
VAEYLRQATNQFRLGDEIPVVPPSGDGLNGHDPATRRLG